MATPTIILKGQWLKEMGFEIGDYISVSCEDGKLIITPDAEKAAMAKAEAEFMGKEMKKLQKRFQAEKEQLHAQFVAERSTEYNGRIGAVEEFLDLQLQDATDEVARVEKALEDAGVPKESIQAGPKELLKEVSASWRPETLLG